jgi:mono/diheme cytochrome c family protein
VHLRGLEMKRIISIATIGCLMMIAGWLLTNNAAAQVKKSSYVMKGEKMFMKYCASCHGVTGKGEGSVAKSLKGVPPDLTLLQAPGEEFPFYRVQTAVDGEKAIEPHGTREMPVWGEVFKKTSGELQKQADVYALVKFIESIQRGGK